MKDWPEFQKNGVLEYRNSKDYNATFFSKLLLQYALVQNNLPFDWKQLNYTEKERPFFKNLEIDFNISHSGKYVALVKVNGKSSEIQKMNYNSFFIFGQLKNQL